MDKQRLVADIPKDLYKAVKHEAVEREVDLKQIVEEALRKYLGYKEGKKGERQ